MLQTENKNLLTIEEAAAYLNLKVSRIRYEVFKKGIPCYKIGRSIRFSISELDSWVEKKKIGEVGLP